MEVVEWKKVWRTRRRRVRARMYSQYLDDRMCVSRDSMAPVLAHEPAVSHAPEDLRSLCPPSPKVEGPPIVQSLERSLISPHRSIVQSYLQENSLHSYHDNGLYEESRVIMGAWPVEDFKDGGCEHEEGDVEGEAGGCARTVDGEDLIGVGSDR